MKAKLDLILYKWVSRKLSVFVVACFGLFSGTLQSGDWVIIATAYVAVEGFADIVTRVKNTNNSL